jgi:hypothetical protein
MRRLDGGSRRMPTELRTLESINAIEKRQCDYWGIAPEGGLRSIIGALAPRVIDVNPVTLIPGEAWGHAAGG